MESNTKITIGGLGPGLIGLTFIALLVLKLIGATTIDWFWVFFPLWIVPAGLVGIALVAAAVVGIMIGTAKLLDWVTKKRRQRKRKKTGAIQ